jgi:hypothetical protein
VSVPAPELSSTVWLVTCVEVIVVVPPPPVTAIPVGATAT